MAQLLQRLAFYGDCDGSRNGIQTLSGSLRGVNPTNWALMSKGTRALRQWRRREGHPEGLELFCGGRISEIESRAPQGDPSDGTQFAPGKIEGARVSNTLY